MDCGEKAAEGLLMPKSTQAKWGEKQLRWINAVLVYFFLRYPAVVILLLTKLEPRSVACGMMDT